MPFQILEMRWFYITCLLDGCGSISYLIADVRMELSLINTVTGPALSVTQSSSSSALLVPSAVAPPSHAPLASQSHPPRSAPAPWARNNSISCVLYFPNPSSESCLRASEVNFGPIALWCSTLQFFMLVFGLYFLLIDTATVCEHWPTLYHITFF